MVILMMSASPLSTGDGAHTTSTETPSRSLSSEMGVLLHPRTTVLAERGSIIPVSFIITHPEGLARVHVPGQADSVEFDDSSCACADPKKINARQNIRTIFFIFFSIISLKIGIGKFRRIVFVIGHCQSCLQSGGCICEPWLLRQLRLFQRLHSPMQR